MDRSVIIANYFQNGREVRVTVQDYEKLVRKQDRKEIAKVIYQRFYGRYIKPFLFEDAHGQYAREFKHGFSVMANSCLLIETLEAFCQGWEDTRNRSEFAFKSFFQRVKRFSKFKNYAIQFYKNVRCGILHQAETTGGWKIRRDGDFFGEKTLTINATQFLDTLLQCLDDYRSELENSNWDSERWDNLRRKMRSIIRNTKQK